MFTEDMSGQQFQQSFAVWTAEAAAAGIDSLVEGVQDPEEALFKSLLALESDSEESQSILFPEPSVNLDKVVGAELPHWDLSTPEACTSSNTAASNSSFSAGVTAAAATTLLSQDSCINSHGSGNSQDTHVDTSCFFSKPGELADNIEAGSRCKRQKILWTADLHTHFCRILETLGPNATPEQVFEALGGASTHRVSLSDLAAHLQAHRDQQRHADAAAALSMQAAATSAAAIAAGMAGMTPPVIAPPPINPFDLQSYLPGMFPMAPAGLMPPRQVGMPGYAPEAAFVQPQSLPMMGGVPLLPALGQTPVYPFVGPIPLPPISMMGALGMPPQGPPLMPMIPTPNPPQASSGAPQQASLKGPAPETIQQAIADVMQQSSQATAPLGLKLDAAALVSAWNSRQTT
ncbi:hypothetical protein WJX73_007928 [Symbiochloris irregularis]|uniref:Uncharacterized protein n=1 Tax=Symbiochloris irregularis TaxID=706552 RepID=A0AAW1NU88_9CHLO